MVDHLDVHRGRYADSVSLMQVSRRVADVSGVTSALVAMATELNLDVLTGMGFAAPDAGPNDLVVAIRADDDAAVTAALDELETALAAGHGAGATGGGFGDGPPPRTVRDAAGAAADADLVLVSTPGEHAYLEALDAVRAGRHVMLFSDNVSLDAEIALKREAADRGLLVMGPDAGTAMVAGVGLGFANVVRPGPVGIVAASGTGAQQLTCLLDDAGVGVSHVLGVGGRDLSAAVGGAATLQALAALDADPATDLIVLLSKPPDQAVAERVRAAAAACTTPVVAGLLGPGQDDLTALAATVVTRVGGTVPDWASWQPPADTATDTDARTGAVDRAGGARLVGLFAGGTLCTEAVLIAREVLGPVVANVGPDADPAAAGDVTTPGHVLVDLGEDEYTRGRPHPMIDQQLRLERLAAEAARADTAVALLDVVLGHGAHTDPAAELAPAIADARATAAAAGRDLAVVVSLCATAGDPQGRDRQAATLVEAGAHVYVSNAAAARAAVARLATTSRTP